jgi:hypothetical protein
MRVLSEGHYRNVKDIELPTNRVKFKTFTQFAEEIEKDGLIHIFAKDREKLVSIIKNDN